MKDLSEIPRHVLSKTSFMRGAQCIRQLYFYKHNYNERDVLSTARKQIFQRGIDTGLLARGLFPGGIDLTPEQPWDYREAIAKTEELAREGKTLYEASFQYRGLVVAVDILVPVEEGFDVYEAKCAARLKGQYIKDVALQGYVMRQAGFEYRDLFLVLLDTSYIRQGEIDLEKLFKKVCVTQQAEALFPEIEQQLETSLEAIQKSSPPALERGEHCNRPYPCDFTGLCYGGAKPAATEEKPVGINVDHTALKAWMKKLQAPISFFDMEAFMPAVPILEGTSPFQSIPFQFGICNENGDYVTHLSEHGKEPRASLVKSLVELVPKEGSILVFDTSMEKQALGDLARFAPEDAGALKNIHHRFVDIRKPFTEGMVSIDSGFDQSLTGLIKSLHQAGVIETGLEDLEAGVSHGMGANMAYENLWYEQDLFEQAAVTDQLHAYQKNDVMAVWLLWKALHRLL